MYKLQTCSRYFSSLYVNVTSSLTLVSSNAYLLRGVKNKSDNNYSHSVVFNVYSDHTLCHYFIGITKLWIRKSDQNAGNILEMHPKVQDRVQHGGGGEEGGGAEGDLQVGGEHCGDLWG